MDRSKIFPYAVLLYGEHAPEEKITTVRSLAEEALELLRDEGKLLYMPELLELCGKLLRKSGVPEEKLQAQLLDRMRQSLLETEQEYGISFEKYRLFDHVIRRFYIDAEMIRKTRTAVGMTQEKLSEDICAQETLARVETGRQTPQSRKLQQMMEKMGRGCGRVNMAMVTEQYETIELKQELSKYIHREECEKTQNALERLETMLDCKQKQNRQYLEAEKILLQNQRSGSEWKQNLSQLRKLFSMTLEYKENDLGKFVLNSNELQILTGMAYIFWEHNQIEHAIEIYQMQKQQFEKSRVKKVFHILEWELAMNNLALSLMESDRCDEIIRISNEVMNDSLCAGKGSCIGRTIVNLAEAMEKLQQKECCVWYKRGIYFLKLYKMDYLYPDVISHIQLMEPSHREQFNDILRLDEQFLQFA